MIVILGGLYSYAEEGMEFMSPKNPFVCTDYTIRAMGHGMIHDPPIRCFLLIMMQMDHGTKATRKIYKEIYC